MPVTRAWGKTDTKPRTCTLRTISITARQTDRHTKELHAEPDPEDERDIVTQMNIGTVSKATLEKLPRDGVDRTIMGFSERIDTILN